MVKLKVKKIVIYKADKGGSRLILDYAFVEQIIISELENTQNFQKLDYDPVPEIRNAIKNSKMRIFIRFQNF